MTNSIRPNSDKIATSHPAWTHLDQIFRDDGSLLDRAAKSIEMVRVTLLSGSPVDAPMLARLLAYAQSDIGATEAHLTDAVGVMSGQPFSL